MFDLVIIGAGPAGLTSAIYASRALLNVLVIEKGAPGGKLLNSHVFDNYPGMQGFSGGDIARSFYKQAESFGTKFEFGNIKEVKSINPNQQEIILDDGKKITSKKIIIATGLSPKILPIDGFKEYFGKGISTCVVCDGAFYRERPIAFIGGGYSATEELSFGSKLASKVYVINNEKELRGEKITLEKIKKLTNVEIHNNSNVTKLLTKDNKITGLEIFDNNLKESKVINVEGIFLYIGAKPNIEFLSSLHIEKNEQGYIKVNSSMETSIPGIYAIGDIIDKKFRQLTIAVSEATIAALEVEQKINH